MSSTRVDFAVIGATPLARLVAGLLASRHGKSVLYQGESQSGYRLPRGIDLSFAPVTRPETWALLQTAIPEAARLISKIAGRSSFSRADPVFWAQSRQGMDSVDHLRHMAQAFKFSAERVPAGLLGAGRKGVMLRDAFLLHRASLEPGLDRWLGKAGVLRLATGTPLLLRADGSAEADAGEQRIEIGQTVLADDAAILAHLSRDSWPAILYDHVASTILTEPGKPLATGLMHQIDSGIVLMQHTNGSIAAMGPGPIEQFSAAVQNLLGPERSLRQVGQSSYNRLVTPDGAPAAGRAGGSGPDVLAGFGTLGAFLAPAIARWLAGAASDAENRWFGARLVDRDPAPSAVSDIGDAR